MKTRAFTLVEVLLTIAIVGIIIAAASSMAKRPSAPQKKVDGRTIVVIDGCEYLSSLTYGGAEVFCHKGNCTNQIHRFMSPEAVR